MAFFVSKETVYIHMHGSTSFTERKEQQRKLSRAHCIRNIVPFKSECLCNRFFQEALDKKHSTLGNSYRYIDMCVVFQKVTGPLLQRSLLYPTMHGKDQVFLGK